MDERTNGLLMIILAIVLIILYAALPNLVNWLYFLLVAVLFIIGLYLYFIRG